MTPEVGRRNDRRISEKRRDPYQTKRKIPEPSVCPDCGSTYRGGRWTWGRRASRAHPVTCPACRRIADSYPAGELILSGAFVGKHQGEITNLARNTETVEQAEHPLHRIMHIETGNDTITITTTDLHLPQRIGKALHHAYKGDLAVNHDSDGYFVRCRWSRDG